MFTSRFVAYKLEIKDIERAEWKENKAIINGLEVVRVRVMGTVVQVKKGPGFCFLTIDDETGVMGVKGFGDEVKLLEKIREGDIIDVIGKLKRYEERCYISPEIVRVIRNPNWYILRKLELMRKIEVKPVEVAEEYIVDEEKRKELIRIIKELDEREGAEFEAIREKLKLSEKGLEELLFSLLKDGFIYEPKPRRYKVLE
ncbi:hypothetical protein DRN62_03100 [Nanoarchaeota archaeon]|nr:MAG: hypothetical protein DRN62_03100 [Nanoarchaeota archaeon]